MAASSLMENCIAATARMPLWASAAAVPEKRSVVPPAPDWHEFSTTSRGVGSASSSRSARLDAVT